jgi:D-amino-acid dehydrogenase
MKVAVLGSGVIGTTTAWYLAREGHEVVVVDRQPAAALETSFANAGEVSPGYASPWAAPGIPLKAIRWLLMRHAPLVLRPQFDRDMLLWLFAMLRNCTAARYAINKARMVRLAEFSRDRLVELRRETAIEYDHRTLGTLQVFRTQAQLDGIGKDVEVLREYGIPFEILDLAGCIAAEPGLAASRAGIVGGLRLPNDETGDCFKFTTALAELARQAGAGFRFNERIERIEASAGRVDRIITSNGEIKADAYVVALGSHSPQLLRPLGFRVPLYPVKGYSITIPVKDRALAPQSTLLDESYKVAITRLGDRIRVGGTAEISGYDLSLPASRRDTLEHSVTSLFPGAGDLGAVTFWAGLRPMTPDGPPILGATSLGTLFLNTGHGTLGWTMACGSAHVLNDIISGRSPAIEVGDLSLSRYAHQ